MAKLTVRELDVRGKRVFVRVDYNVPMEEKDGQMAINDVTRIKETLPTLELLIENGARIIQQFERWERFLDARHIVDGHLPVFFLHGHVVIHAHKDAFAAHVQFSNRQLGHIKTGAKE